MLKRMVVTNSSWVCPSCAYTVWVVVACIVV